MHTTYEVDRSQQGPNGATSSRPDESTKSASKRRPKHHLLCSKCGAWYCNEEPKCPVCESRPTNGSSPERVRLYGLPCLKCGRWYFSDEPNCPVCESQNENGPSLKDARLYGLPCSQCGAWYFSDEPNCPVCGKQHTKPATLIDEMHETTGQSREKRELTAA